MAPFRSYRFAAVVIVLLQASCEPRTDPPPKSVSPTLVSEAEKPEPKVSRSVPEALPVAPPVAPPVEYDGPCPKGMKLVDGGAFTAAQRISLTERFGRAAGTAELSFEIAPFCLAVLETTKAEFHECIVAGACVSGRDFEASKGRPEPDQCMSAEIACGGKYASEPNWNMTIEGARAYCEFRNTRIPTVGEWFWAATGGEEARRYPWGDAKPTERHLNVCDERCLREACCGDVPENEPLKSCAVPACLRKAQPFFTSDDGYSHLAPVGSYPEGAGRWGHLDLLGNAAEVLTLRHQDYACGGDANSEKDVPLDLNQHECEHIPSTTIRAVRCAASPRQNL